MDHKTTPQPQRLFAFLASALLALTLLMGFTGSIFAQPSPPTPNDVEFRRPTVAQLEAEKLVNREEAQAGSTIQYTLVISNSGESALASVTLTDTLPSSITYKAGSLDVPAGTLSGASDQVITWTGALPAMSQVSLSFEAVLTDTLAPGTVLTNTMVVTGGDMTISRTATTTVIEETAFTGFLYLPVVQRPYLTPETLTANATLPNSNNEWTINWALSSEEGLTAYEVQESHSPDFESYDVVYRGTDKSVVVDHAPSAANVYFYRVVAEGKWGGIISSETLTVIGNYYDDFSNQDTGWRVRRTSYLEKTHAYYQDGNLIILVDDRWDWLLASPLKPAPAVPYVIEYRSRVHDASNLVSGGVFFGGDWTGEDCPDVGNVYDTDHCFNEFYNYNYIFFGPLKVLWEKVEEVEWCPNCEGSLLKRLGPTQEVSPVLDNGPSLDWHTYRIEVREDGARLYIDDKFIKHFTDTEFIHNQYFGTFASTDEYKPSIWFYDYFEITRLDE